jgi:hypothetical protein
MVQGSLGRRRPQDKYFNFAVRFHGCVRREPPKNVNNRRKITTVPDINTNLEVNRYASKSDI